MLLPVFVTFSSVAAAALWPDLDTPVRTGRHASADAALVVGIERYDELGSAPGSLQDAGAVWTWLGWSRGVPVERITRADQLTQTGLEPALSRVIREVGDGGTLWVWWSGLGLPTPEGHRFLPTADAPADAPWERGVALDELLVRLSVSKAAHIVVVLDVSFLGVDRDGEPVVDPLRWPEALPSAWPDPRVAVVIGGDEVAPVHPSGRGTLLTWELLGALRGWADGAGAPRDKAVTLGEAQSWVNRRYDLLEHSQPIWWPGSADRGLVLVDGDVQRPPPLPETVDDPWPGAQALPEVVDPEDEAALRTAAAEAEQQAQARASADWSGVQASGPPGSEGQRLALRAFLDRWDGVELLLPQGSVVFVASQVPQARLLLASGGRTVTSLITSVAWTPPPRSGLAPLWVAATELTTRQAADLMGKKLEGPPDLPAAGFSWRDALAMCNTLSAREGLVPVYTLGGPEVEVDRSANGWRLPTEAEWEAIAGDRPWAGFDDPARACDFANLAEGGACADGLTGPSPVRSLRAVRGLYGLTGNVAELVWDAWAPVRSPLGAASWPGADRVAKGGSWLTPAADARSKARRQVGWLASAPDVGMRVVRPVDAVLTIPDLPPADE